MKIFQTKELLCSFRKIWYIARTLTIMLLISILHVSAEVYSQKNKLSFEIKDINLKEAIKQVEIQTNYLFLYNVNDIKGNIKVNLAVKDQQIEKVLNELLKNTGLGYTIRDRHIILRSKKESEGINSTSSVQQGIKITGTVSDNSGSLMPGVNIVIRGTSLGTTTDINGEFSLTAPSDTTVLLFRFIGYQTQEVVVGNRKIIAVTLNEAATDIGEVVVVAFGKQKKESVIGSITTINPSELKVPSSNLTTAFAGRMSGLISYQRSGEPGADNAQFFIRGVTTFGYKKDPLILIDSNESTTQELSRLQADDIASFSIMKDATAAALYGSRGANGVILVSTKSGVAGKVKVNVRYEEAISMPTKMVELADPITYMQMHNEAVRTRNPLGAVPYSQSKIDNTIAGGNPYVYPANDWYGTLFKDKTHNHRLNFNAGGGGQIARYYLAGSYSNDNGVLNVDKKNNFNNNIKLNRYMLRANINIDITKTTEAVVRMSGSFDDYSGPLDGGSDLFMRVMKTNPALFPAYYLPDEANKYTQHILFGNSGTNALFNNPYADMTKGYKEYKTSQMSVQFELKQKLDILLEGLSVRALFNTNRYAYNEARRSYRPFFYQVSSYDKANDQYTLTGLNTSIGSEYLSYTPGGRVVNAATYFETGANWAKTFVEKHEVSAMVVFTMRDELRSYDDTDLQKSLPYRDMKLAGRVTYAYDSRYLFEANFGYNGSERFSTKERWGFFPSAGIGWVLSNEAWWGEDLKKTVSSLKLKATYGSVGNAEIGDVNDRFFYLSNVNLEDSNKGSSFGTYGNWGGGTYYRPGVSISRYANDDITWETAKKLNLTAEVGLFNAIEVQVEVYKEKRSNILMDRASIPTTMGLQAPTRANVGEASSKGIDISFNMNHSFNKDAWITGLANFTYATSEFRVYEEPDYSSTPWKSHVGYSLNQNWGYIAERLFVDNEEVRNSPRQFGDYMAGDIKYKDLDGDGKITQLDQAAVGFPTSPEIVYGFGLSGGWKWFDLSFFFQGLARESFWITTHDDLASGVVDTSPFLAGQNALLKAYADSHWSENNRDLYALWPRFSPTWSENNTQTSTWLMRNGSFLRLKSVEVGYSLPEKLISRARITNLRIYFTGNNLLCFSKFKMWDPEMGGNGLGYPVQKVYNFGIQLSF